MFKKYVLSRILWLFYSLLSLTWRKTLIEPPEFQKQRDSNLPLVIAHWHGDELAVLYLAKRYRLVTMISTSSDGDLVNFLIHKLGGQTVRGSSTRQGTSALKGLVRLCRTGRVASMAVDGPKGPIYKAKAGVFEISRLIQAPIFPLGVAASSYWRFSKSWNKAILPWPFARVAVFIGEPLNPVSREEDPKSPALSSKLEESLFDARRRAAKLIAPN